MANGSPTFTVSLKVGGDNIKLLIAVDDSTDEVFQRLSAAYPTCHNKKTEILEKLIASLKLQLHNQAINSSLLHSISQFLYRNNEEISQEQDPPNRYSCQKSIKVDAPDKTLQKINNNKENEKISFKKRLSCQSQKQQDSQLPVKKFSVPAKPKLSTPNKSNKVKAVGNSVQRSKKCNPDIIKACELIMKKTQNTEMKLMAKEFLKEKGYLKEEKQKSMIQNKKKYTINDSPQNGHQVQMNQIVTQKTSNNKNKQSTLEKCQTSEILTNITKIGAQRQNNRFSKYKYLQSSLVNQSLSKDYQSLSKHTESSILKSSEVRVKKYSYLD